MVAKMFTRLPDMSVEQQKVDNAFAATYCQIGQMSTIGKPIYNQQLKLKQLYLASWYLCNGGECDVIDCWLNKNSVC